MTVYIDPGTYCCYSKQNADGTRISYEEPQFDGKCDAFIEGYRLVPADEKWTREDGRVFNGLMIAPWKDYAVLQAYQEQYEAMSAEMADMQNALTILGVEADG